MGQIFNACAYDIDTRTCCVYDADKFHANCYSICGTVFSMHYLLRQKPYRIMWGGGYVTLWDNLKKFSRTEDLLGLSTYIDYDPENENHTEEDKEKMKFILDNHKLWKSINVWEEASKYFDWDKTKSTKYSGYLLNHTQKLAIDLSDYHKQSKYSTPDGLIMAIDAVPVLTETGEGTPMAFFDGITIETTEELVGTWCGDLLQIVEDLPKDYRLINCCFAEIWSKAKDYYRKFGVNDDGYVLKDSHGTLFEASGLDFYFKRVPLESIKAEVSDDKIRFSVKPKKKS